MHSELAVIYRQHIGGFTMIFDNVRDALAQQFERPDPTRRWREGVVKSSFTYLLLDPRYLEQE